MPISTVIMLIHTSSHHSFLVPVVAHFRTGGFWGNAFLNQQGLDVSVNFSGSDILSFNDSARWRIHELPVHTSIDLKLRCTPKFLGLQMYNGDNGDRICNMKAASLVLHSIVLLVVEEVVACGTIHFESRHYFPATVKFQSGVFGRLYIVEWPGE